MLWGRALAVARLSGWFVSLGGSVWSLVAWIWGSGLSLIAEFGAPEYASLTAMFGAGLLYSSWVLAQPVRPSRRLEGLVDEMMKVRGSVGQYTAYVRLEGMSGRERRSRPLPDYDEESVRKLARALDELKVPHPSTIGETVAEDWSKFLIRLGAEARVRDIRRARSLWKTIQAEEGGE